MDKSAEGMTLTLTLTHTYTYTQTVAHTCSVPRWSFLLDKTRIQSSAQMMTDQEIQHKFSQIPPQQQQQQRVLGDGLSDHCVCLCV